MERTAYPVVRNFPRRLDGIFHDHVFPLEKNCTVCEGKKEKQSQDLILDLRFGIFLPKKIQNLKS
jgi:hypothetical protein